MFARLGGSNENVVYRIMNDWIIDSEEIHIKIFKKILKGRDH